MHLRRTLVACALAVPLAIAGCSDSEDAPSTEPVDAGVTPDAVDSGPDTPDGGPDVSADVAADPSDAADAAPIVVPPYEEGLDAGPTGLRRLTRAQYLNIIADVFGTEIVVPPLAEPDLSVGGLLSVGASAVSMSARGVETLEVSSFAIVEQVFAEDGIRNDFVQCAPASPTDEACARESINALGQSLWRRPLTDDELDVELSIFTAAASALDDFYAGMEFATAGLLESPNFVFRVELGSEREDGTWGFDDFELASRLSFFLWNTTPDAELLEAAANGELTGEEGLLAHASRMIDDPRSRRGLRNFFSEQLELYRLDALSKDPTLFEQYNVALGPDSAEETLLSLERIVFDAESDFRDVMTTRQTFVNPRLAALYDVPAPVPDGFGFVELPVGHSRVGLLGHASWLNLHSHAVSSSATLRGKAVREVLLCQVIPPPPSNVDVSIPEPTGETLTLRDRVAEHLVDPACTGCHEAMDPIGLGLENFDAIGVWRVTDNGAEIDVTGSLDTVDFANPVELARSIRNHPAFAPCTVRTLARYATGREESRDELSHLDVLATHFAAGEYRLKPLLLEIVMSPMFRNAGVPQ